MAGKPLRPVKKKKTARVQQEEGTRYPDLENLLAKMAELKSRWKDEGILFYQLEGEAIALMRKYGIHNYDAGGVAGSFRQGSSDVIDWAGLEKRVSAEIWKQVLDPPQPSKERLDALVQLGIIDASVVKELTTSKPSKAYVIATMRGGAS